MGGGNNENKDDQIELLLESNRAMAKEKQRLLESNIAMAKRIRRLRKLSQRSITIGVRNERKTLKIPIPNDCKIFKSSVGGVDDIYDDMITKGIKILIEERKYEIGNDRLMETAAEYLSEQGLNIIKLTDQSIDDDNFIGCFTFLVEPTDDPPKKFYRSITKKSAHSKYEFRATKKYVHRYRLKKYYKYYDMKYYSTPK